MTKNIAAHTGHLVDEIDNTRRDLVRSLSRLEREIKEIREALERDSIINTMMSSHTPDLSREAGAADAAASRYNMLVRLAYSLPNCPDTAPTVTALVEGLTK